MESFLPLTVLGAIIGFYAILPEYKKVRIGYSFGKIDLLMLGIILLVMLANLVLSSYDLSSSINSTVSFNQVFSQIPHYNPITNQLLENQFKYSFLFDMISMVAVLVIFLLFFIKFRTKKIRICDKKYFIDKMDELFYKGEYTSVISLIEDNYNNLMKFKERECPDEYWPFTEDQIDSMIRRSRNRNQDEETNDKLRDTSFSIIQFVKRAFTSSIYEPMKNKLTPLFKKDTYTTYYSKIKSNAFKKDAYRNYYEKIVCKILKLKLFKILKQKLKKDYYLQENMEIRLLDYEYIKKIIKYNPYFGLKIVIDKDLNPDFRNKFVHLYFKELIRNKNSVLYREICNTQDQRPYRYNISPNNKILNEVIFNIEKAYEDDIYKPIGDITLEILDKQYKKNKDHYNDYKNKLDVWSDERIKDPLFMVVRFFDIMIIESIYQNIGWHMWLFYYNHLVEKICKNYEITEFSTGYEFPNSYSSLLYDIFSNLVDWIKLIEEDNEEIIELKLEHIVKLDNNYCEHQNENIIKSSIICLDLCAHYVIGTENIPLDLKYTLVWKVFDLYVDLILSKIPLAIKYSEVIKCCILKTAQNSNYDEEKEFYIELLNYKINNMLHTENGYDELVKLKENLENSEPCEIERYEGITLILFPTQR